MMKVQVRKSILIGTVFLSLIFMTGCGTLETLVKKDGATTPLTEWIGANENKEVSVPASTTGGEGKSVALYFPDKSGQFLLKEERMLPKTVSLARETVNQWLKGPMETDSMQSSVSTATVLRDIAIRDNVIVVDFSKEFMLSNSKVAPEVALYGLVNTLTQFSTVKQVQIRIEGEPLSKYGTIDATHLAYKGGLIKGNVPAAATVPKSGGAKTSPEVTAPNNSSKASLPESPSSINLFNYPPSST